MSKRGRGWWDLVSFGFHLLYNQFAWTYDFVSVIVSLGKWHDWQRVGLHHLNVQHGGLLLEIAYGTGVIQADLADEPYEAVGIDISPFMARIARKKLLKKQIPPRLAQASAYRLPFSASRFDGVLSTFPAPFIVDDPVLQEISRVMKPGSVLAIVVSGELTLNNVLVRFLEWLYTITGQRSPWHINRILERFTNAGLAPEVVIEELPGSRVVLIKARKTAAEET